MHGDPMVHARKNQPQCRSRDCAVYYGSTIDIEPHRLVHLLPSPCCPRKVRTHTSAKRPPAFNGIVPAKESHKSRGLIGE